MRFAATVVVAMSSSHGSRFPMGTAMQMGFVPKRPSFPCQGATIGDAYGQLVTGIGSDSRDAQRAADTAQARADVLAQRRSSISGVSLDEEMTNMIRFQQGYQAASRALNAMDDAISLLITRTGRAGL